MTKIAFVTVLYNSSSVLEDFLNSLSSQKGPLIKLFAVDNASSDASMISLIVKCGEVGLDLLPIRNSNNLGFAAATNQGIVAARDEGFEWIIVGNNDIVIEDESAIASLLDAAADKPDTIIIPKIVYHYNEKLLWYAGGHVSLLRGVPRTEGFMKPDSAKYSRARYTSHAPACFLLINIAVFNRVGMFDTDYFVYLEDSDFVERAKRKDVRLFFYPDVKIRHKASVLTGGATSLFSIYNISKNTVIFLRKNNNLLARFFYLSILVLQYFLKWLSYSGEQRSRLLAGFMDGLRLKTFK